MPSKGFFGWFNRVFARTTQGYCSWVGRAIRKTGRLLIVYALIIVAAVALVLAIKLSKEDMVIPKDNRAKGVAMLKGIAIVIEQYKTDTGEYPKTLAALVNRPAPYLEGGVLPNDPWGREWIYVCPGVVNAGTYDLKSLGADGIDSGDDIGNMTAAKK